MDVKVEKFQPYTNPRRSNRSSSSSLSGGIGKMVLRSGSRISTSSDDVIDDDITIVKTTHRSNSRRISSGLGDFEDIIQSISYSKTKSCAPVVEIIEPEQAETASAGVNGPIAGSLFHVNNQADAGFAGGTALTLNNGSSSLVYWKLGSTSNNASAYIFAEPDGSGGYNYITYGAPGAPLLASNDPSFSDPLTLDIDNDDLTTDSRVFYLFASNLTSTNEGHLFPSEFFDDESYSVQDTGNLAFVQSHSSSADTFKLL